MIGLVFRKEVREFLRDKRVVSGALVGPVVLMLVFVFTFGVIAQSLGKSKAPKIHVVAPARPNAFLTALEQNPEVQIVRVENRERGVEMVKKGEARVLLEFAPDFADATGEIQAVYDPDEALSAIALRTFGAMVTAANRAQLDQTLAQAGIAKEAVEPIRLKEVEVPKDQKAMGSSALIGLLPYLIVIWAFYGGFSVVSDLVAGEKERSTLETLLITPVSRTQVAMGKFLALGCVCLISSLSSLVTVLIIGVSGTSHAKALFPEGIHLTPLALLAILAILIPLVAFFAGLMLAISAFAKNTREAQTHLTLLSFVVLIPAISSQFIGFTEAGRAWWIKLVPILNSSDAIRSALLGRLDAESALVTIGISLVLGAIGVITAIKLFEREEVLVRI